MANSTDTIIWRDGKQIGLVRSNTFHKRVNSDKHLLVKMDAWGIDYLTFMRTVKVLKEVRIYDTKDKITYVCTPSDFLAKGNITTFPGNGTQIFLSRNNFKQEKV